MIESIERRVLLHNAFVSNGILFLEGEPAVDDQLSVTLVNGNYRAQELGDGFSMDFPAEQVTAGINVTGDSGDDSIIIGADISLPTTLDGGAGNDTISGAIGKDSITGGGGADRLLGNGNRDMIIGGDGNDTCSGGSKNDTLVGGAGADSLVGSAGNGDRADYSEKLIAVNLSLDGTANDGTAGENDNITETVEYFFGGAGADFIRGSGKANLIVGNAGNDTLIGGSGDDTILAGSGSDSIQGQAGDDSLNSRENADDGSVDTVSGGSGTDTADVDVGVDVLNTVP